MNEPNAKHWAVIEGYKRHGNARKAYQDVYKCAYSTALSKGCKVISRWQEKFTIEADQKQSELSEVIDNADTSHYDLVEANFKNNYNMALRSFPPDIKEANRANEGLAKMYGLFDDKDKKKDGTKVFTGIQILNSTPEKEAD